MNLTANPFDPTTGQLLPVYRDAYVRGDLSGASARAVEGYLRRDADQAHCAVMRWHQMANEEHEAAAPTTWVQKQLKFIQQQPERQRAAAWWALPSSLPAPRWRAPTGPLTTACPLKASSPIQRVRW